MDIQANFNSINSQKNDRSHKVVTLGDGTEAVFLGSNEFDSFHSNCSGQMNSQIAPLEDANADNVSYIKQDMNDIATANDFFNEFAEMLLEVRDFVSDKIEEVRADDLANVENFTKKKDIANSLIKSKINNANSKLKDVVKKEKEFIENKKENDESKVKSNNQEKPIDSEINKKADEKTDLKKDKI